MCTVLRDKAYSLLVRGDTNQGGRKENLVLVRGDTNQGEDKIYSCVGDGEVGTQTPWFVSPRTNFFINFLTFGNGNLATKEIVHEHRKLIFLDSNHQ